MPNKIKEIKKGQFLYYNQIEKFAEDNNYNVQDYGGSTLGESFIVLKHNDKDITISFVLESATSNQYVYECVYSDIK